MQKTDVEKLLHDIGFKLYYDPIHSICIECDEYESARGMEGCSLYEKEFEEGYCRCAYVRLTFEKLNEKISIALAKNLTSYKFKK
jgi:hypothetical protein